LPLPNKKKKQNKTKPAKRKHTKEFCSVWAEELCASDKSWYIYNQAMWLEEPREEQERRVCEPLKDTGTVIARR